MYLRDLLQSCLRRWYFLLLGLALTGCAGFLTLGAVSPTYEANASVVLLPPDAVIAVGDNPYLYLGGLDQALGVLQVKVNSPEIAKSIEAPFASSHATFVAAKDVTTTGPIMLITVTGDDAPAVIALLGEVINALPPNLLSLQEDLEVSKSSRITTMVLARDRSAEISHKRQIRALIVICGGGAVGAVLAVGWLDRTMAGRLERRLRDAAGSHRHGRRALNGPPPDAATHQAGLDHGRQSVLEEEAVGAGRATR